MAKRLIYDLCGGTGGWSRPYSRNGNYKVKVVDLKNGGDVRLLERPLEPVHGVLAAPVCTVFANSGARWPRSDDDMREGLALVDACLRFIIATDPHWWSLENPVGSLRRWLGPPRMYFDPCDFGDPYTKRTCLWGKFNFPKQNPVEPTEGSKMHLKYGGKSDRTKTARSATPPGFARAFFLANP